MPRAQWIGAAIVVVAAGGTLVVQAGRQAVAHAQCDSRRHAEAWIARHVPGTAPWIGDSQGPKLANVFYEVREGTPVPFDKLHSAAQRGEVRWAVVNGYTAATMLDDEVARRYPERTEGYVRLVTWLRGNAVCRRRFPGRRAGGRGPEVTIFELTGAARSVADAAIASQEPTP